MKRSTCLLALLCIISAETHAQKDIAQWGGPERNGIYPEKNLLTSWPAGGPQLIWKYELKSGLNPNTPIYRDGHLFVYDGADEGSIMLKINEDGTGAGKVWSNPEFMPIQGDAVVLGDRLFGLGGGDKKFICSD